MTDTPTVRAALAEMVDVIEVAGLHNLSAGVEVGRLAWYVKAATAIAAAKTALAEPAAPVQPLTDEQIVDALVAAGLDLAYRCYERDIECARAIERAHNIGDPK